MAGLGWVGGGGLPEIKANSTQFQVKLPTGAELGSIKRKCATNFGRLRLCVINVISYQFIKLDSSWCVGLKGQCASLA